MVEVDSLSLADGSNGFLLADGSQLYLAGPVVNLDSAIAPDGEINRSTSKLVRASLAFTGFLDELGLIGLLKKIRFNVVFAPQGRVHKSTHYNIDGNLIPSSSLSKTPQYSLLAIFAPFAALSKSSRKILSPSVLAPFGSLRKLKDLFRAVLSFTTQLSFRLRGRGKGYAKTNDLLQADFAHVSDEVTIRDE